MGTICTTLGKTDIGIVQLVCDRYPEILNIPCTYDALSLDHLDFSSAYFVNVLDTGTFLQLYIPPFLRYEIFRMDT